MRLRMKPVYMPDISTEKIIDLLKTKGAIEATKYVKATYKVSLKEAKELVDDVIAKNPGITPAKEKATTAQSLLSLAIMVVLIWGGCKMCGGEKVDEAKKDLTRKERIENLFSSWDGSQPEVVKWIKANIKDPDSYKHIETKFIDKTDRVGVITTFTATNSFGGRVKTVCLAQIDTLGTLIKAELQE